MRDRAATRGAPTGARPASRSARRASEYNRLPVAIILDVGLTPEEIRVLQEFRRLASDSLQVEAIVAIRHPSGGGEEPAHSLVRKGYLTSSGPEFSLTPKAKEFLAIDAKP